MNIHTVQLIRVMMVVLVIILANFLAIFWKCFWDSSLFMVRSTLRSPLSSSIPYTTIILLCVRISYEKLQFIWSRLLLKVDLNFFAGSFNYHKVQFFPLLSPILMKWWPSFKTCCCANNVSIEWMNSNFVQQQFSREKIRRVLTALVVKKLDQSLIK